MENVFTNKLGTKNMLTERKFDVYKQNDILIDDSNNANLAYPLAEEAAIDLYE